MNIRGTITHVLPVRSGTSKSGKGWKSQEYVMLYDNSNANYPKSIVFSVMGQKIDEFQLRQGGQYELEIDFYAREWQSRFFLQANCWKATRLDVQQPAPQPAAYPQPDPYAAAGMQPVQPPSTPQSYEGDPLPF